MALTTCLEQKQNLDYPTELEEIKNVTLTRPDKESNGKFATVKDLTQGQIKELLEVLENAEPVGPMKFIPDFYIVFVTKTGETQRIRIIDNKVKGYNNDYSYEIDRLEFLDEF